MIHANFLPYAHQSINDDDRKAVSRALSQEIITRGAEVEAFEQEVATYCGVRYAVAFNSGTSALIASCYAADLTKYDRLISSANTFIGTIAGAYTFGATPILVDIDPKTGSAKLEQLVETSKRPSTRGKSVLIPVHFAGPPLDIEKLESLLSDPNFVIIEDAAHAFGTRYSAKGPRVGSCAFSQMTAFSFHPAKTITTGEGGIVTTNEEDLARRLRLYRNNGIERDPQYLEGAASPGYYEVQNISNNYNFTEFQAALGRSQLSRVESFITKRKELVALYRQQLKNFQGVQLMSDLHNSYTAFHLFVIQIDFAARKKNRSKIMQQLQEMGIGTNIHYIPLYRHPFCKKEWGDLSSFFPEMESYYEKTLTLPLYYDMTEDDVIRVVGGLKKCLA